MSKVETLLLGFSKDTSGEDILLVSTRDVGRQSATPIKLLHGDCVKEIYKQLTDNELVLEEDK